MKMRMKILATATLLVTLGASIALAQDNAAPVALKATVGF